MIRTSNLVELTSVPAFLLSAHERSALKTGAFMCDLARERGIEGFRAPLVYLNDEGATVLHWGPLAPAEEAPKTLTLVEEGFGWVVISKDCSNSYPRTPAPSSHLPVDQFNIEALQAVLTTTVFVEFFKA